MFNMLLMIQKQASCNVSLMPVSIVCMKQICMCSHKGAAKDFPETHEEPATDAPETDVVGRGPPFAL